MTDLSVIIPLAPQEKAWKKLLPDLEKLPDDVEILFITTKITKEMQTRENPKIRWILSRAGRAQQLNKGAKQARHNFLWFLHADSRFTDKTISALLNSIEKMPDALHYFNLEYIEKLPLIKSTSFGARIRSHWLDLPFGDQGLCISKKLFEKIGGYPENVSYGEDHLFVWRAKQHGIKIHCTGAIVLTSARKYIDQGWGYVTLKHQFIWIKQAIPEWLKLIKIKLKGH